MTDRIRVEVVYALPERQTLIGCEVAAGTTALGAVQASGILDRHPELARGVPELGIFGKAVPGERVLRAGERVEIYRPLKADPKEVRRRLAAEGKSMGRSRDGGT